MSVFKRKKKGDYAVPVLASAGTNGLHPFSSVENYMPSNAAQNELYRTLREAIPVIDAAVYKTVRLTGGFRVEAEDERFSEILDDFVKSVKTDAGQSSLNTFIDTYFEALLTYGTAVGEMVTDSDGKVIYLYNAPPEDIVLKRDKNDFSAVCVCRADSFGDEGCADSEKTVLSTLNAEAGRLNGSSILKGLPFVSSILIKIFNATGQNWDRVGNVRFAVTYKPKDENTSKAYARDRAMQIASQWGEAMKSSEVRDFIAVGDVDIKVIGADNQILDSEVPVRQILEQITAKLSLPPFMLGLSWSTTERMSSEQADALTTELEHFRRILTPVIEKICRMHLRAFGYTKRVRVVWDDITLKDTLDEANARYLNAEADEIYSRLGKESEVQDE